MALKKHNRRTPDYLSRREQVRLMLLVFSLGLVIVAMNKLRSPEVRARIGEFFGQGSNELSSEDARPAGISVENAEVDDAPLSVEELQKISASAKKETKPVGLIEINPKETKEDSSAPLETGPKLFPGIDRYFFEEITDHSQWRRREHGALEHFWSVLTRTTQKALETESIGNVSYTQLLRQPSVYRGRSVHVRGTVMDLHEEKTKMQLGFDHFYRLGIQTKSGGSNPIFVYVLQLPEGFPQKQEIEEAVEVTGLFIKDWSYTDTREVFKSAPIILAKEIRWIPKKVNPTTTSDFGGSLVWCVVAAVSIAGAFVTWMIRRSNHWKRTMLLCVIVGFGVIGSQSLMAQEASESQAKKLRSSRAVLEIAGVDESYFHQLVDGKPLGEYETEVMLKILYRASRFNPIDIQGWATELPENKVVLKESHALRGEMFFFAGRIFEVVEKKPAVEVRARYEMESYYELHGMLEPTQTPVTLVCKSVPKRWPIGKRFKKGEPFSAEGVFLKVAETEKEKARLVFACGTIHWHPDGSGSLAVPHGWAVLGALGADVASLDHVVQNTRLQNEENSPFFELLVASGKMKPLQLVRAAKRSLNEYSDLWNKRAKAATDPKTKELYTQIAAQVVTLAQEGVSSVTPLFRNAPDEVGQPFVFEGIARRAIKIYVGENDEGEPSDVFKLYGIDHYYELEVFMADSQNLPLVFCVRTLPDGFPEGEKISAKVEIAGFFLKKWAYLSEKSMRSQSEDGRALSQLAPLLIGSGLRWIVPEEEAGVSPVEISIGVLFVLTIGVIWWCVRRYAKGDDAHFRKVVEANFRVEPGKSLNDAGIEAEEGPDFSHLN